MHPGELRCHFIRRCYFRRLILPDFTEIWSWKGQKSHFERTFELTIHQISALKRLPRTWKRVGKRQNGRRAAPFRNPDNILAWGARKKNSFFTFLLSLSLSFLCVFLTFHLVHYLIFIYYFFVINCNISIKYLTFIFCTNTITFVRVLCLT